MSEITPEPISIRELALNGHHFADTMIMRVVCNWMKANNEEFPHKPGDPLQVVLTINGVQMPFVEAIDGLQSCLHEIAEKHAEKILAAKTGDLDRKLSRIGWRLENMMRMELQAFADDREEPYEVAGYAPPKEETPPTEV